MSIFVTEAANFVPDMSTDSWDRLFLMQHYRAPTRLLDWSESLDVALFFCVSFEKSSPVDRALWVLNPFRLNFNSVRQNIIFDKSDPIHYEYYEEIRKNEKVPHELPIAVQPPWTNPRIIAQRSCFTIHGYNPNPLENLNPKNRGFVKKIPIPSHLVKPIQAYLRDRQVRKLGLFQDLESLSDDLVERFALDR